MPGMTPRQVAQAWGIPIRPHGGGSPGCETATINTRGVHGYALFEEGRLGALFFDRGVRTPSGIRIGSTVPQLVRTYSYDLKPELAAYELGGLYFFLTRRQAP